MYYYVLQLIVTCNTMNCYELLWITMYYYVLLYYYCMYYYVLQLIVTCNTMNYYELLCIPMYYHVLVCISVILIGELFPNNFHIFLAQNFVFHIFLIFFPRIWNELSCFFLSWRNSTNIKKWRNASVSWYVYPIISKLWKFPGGNSSIRMSLTMHCYLLLLLRRTILNRTYGKHKHLYISLFLLTTFGPIYYGLP